MIGRDVESRREKLDRKSGEKVGVEGVVEARVDPRKRGSRYSARRWKLFQTVPVCTSGRFLSSGWTKSRGKLRFKLVGERGKGWRREYRTTVAPLCASTG